MLGARSLAKKKKVKGRIFMAEFLFAKGSGALFSHTLVSVAFADFLPRELFNILCVYSFVHRYRTSFAIVAWMGEAGRETDTGDRYSKKYIRIYTLSIEEFPFWESGSSKSNYINKISRMMRESGI